MSGELLGLIGSALTLASILARWGWKRYLDANAVERVILTESEINATLGRLRERTDALRATVLECHNGGDLPEIGESLYSTARWDSVADGASSLVETWRKVKLDAVATRLLRDIIVIGSVIVRRADLPPGQVRDNYGVDGVQTGLSVAIAQHVSWWRAMFIPRSRQRWWWLCLDWDVAQDPAPEAARDARIAARHIGSLLYGGGRGRR